MLDLLAPITTGSVADGARFLRDDALRTHRNGLRPYATDARRRRGQAHGHRGMALSVSGKVSGRPTGWDRLGSRSPRRGGCAQAPPAWYFGTTGLVLRKPGVSEKQAL